jgi:hypothetical protein
MLRILDHAAVRTGTADSRIGFATEGGGAWKIWDRFLILDGKKAYHLGNVCQTCSFLFQRLHGANASINTEGAVEALASGVRTISDPVVAQLGAGLPADDYVACLSATMLQLVFPRAPDDYFVKEQLALWGTNPFWNLPHDPRVPYYRAGKQTLEVGGSCIIL